MVLSKEDLQQNNILITKMFENGSYGMFRKFCIKENLIFTSDITYEHLWKFEQCRGVGLKKIVNVLNILKEFDYTEFTTDFKCNEIFKGVLVSQVFENKAYSLFYEFCRYQDLKYINDITENHLWEFQKMQDVGREGYLDVIKRLKKLSIGLREKELSEFEVGEMYDYIKDLKISDVVALLKIEDTDFVDTKILEMEGKGLKELKHVSNITFLAELSNRLSKLQIPKNSLLRFKSQLKESQRVVLKLRILEKKTLEKVGTELGRTREGVRQIEKKLKSEINNFFSTNHLNDLIMIIIDNKNYVSATDLIALLGEDHIDIVNLLKMSEAPLYYNHEFDVFFFKELDRRELQERIESFHKKK